VTHAPTAIVTASYAPDFERCRILCDTIDKHVTGYTKHYILVDNTDAALFAPLAGARRRIVTDKELLPRWIMRWPGAFAPRGKPVWLSTRTKPLHGWHMQQLRRIAIALNGDEAAYFYCDSDTAFIKPFDLGAVWRGGALRLYRETDAADSALSDHALWLEHAAQAFATPAIAAERHNYVRSFIAWRKDTVTAMCAKMEAAHGRHWVSVVANTRKFSECTLYGAYADLFGHRDDHWHDSRDFCRIHWFNPPPIEKELRAFLADMEPYEVGFGVQSFIDVDSALIRKIALGQ